MLTSNPGALGGALSRLHWVRDASLGLEFIWLKKEDKSMRSQRLLVKGEFVRLIYNSTSVNVQTGISTHVACPGRARPGEANDPASGPHSVMNPEARCADAEKIIK